MTEDTRSREQHAADIAAATLARLTRMDTELRWLGMQLSILADYAADQHPDLGHHEALSHTASVVAGLRCCTRAFIRDLASRLPIRGLDYE